MLANVVRRAGGAHSRRVLVILFVVCSYTCADDGAACDAVVAGVAAAERSAALALPQKTRRTNTTPTHAPQQHPTRTRRRSSQAATVTSSSWTRCEGAPSAADQSGAQAERDEKHEQRHYAAEPALGSHGSDDVNATSRGRACKGRRRGALSGVGPARVQQWFLLRCGKRSDVEPTSDEVSIKKRKNADILSVEMVESFVMRQHAFKWMTSAFAAL